MTQISEPTVEYGIYVPPEVRKDKNLSWGERVVLVIIHMLDNEGNCYASNEYIAKLADTSPGTVAGYITKLKKLGWIEDIGDKLKRRLTTRLRAKVTFSRGEELLNDGLAAPNSTVRSSSPDISNLNSVEKKKKKSEEPLPPPLLIFKTHFPKQKLNPYQEKVILDKVDNEGLWKDTCELWALKGYKSRNIVGMIETYERGKEGTLIPSRPAPPSKPVQAVSNDGCPFCTATPPMPCPRHKEVRV